MRRLLLVSLAIVLFSGCAVFEKYDQRPLGEVVDAVQYAVEELARDNVWKATQQEQAHWAQACKNASDDSSKKCVRSLLEADKFCRQLCPAGNCGAAHGEICRKMSVGEDRVGLCDSEAKDSAWCKVAEACTIAVGERSRTCSAAASISYPQLTQAQVTLAIEQTQEAGVSANLMVVSFGTSNSRISANTKTIRLLPRVRDLPYGSGPLPPMPPDKQTSERTIAFARELKSLLKEAVASVVRESEAGSIARPPMALDGIDLEVSLVLKRDGTLGIEKAWPTSVLGIKLGGGAGETRSNVLRISYARPP